MKLYYTNEVTEQGKVQMVSGVGNKCLEKQQKKTCDLGHPTFNHAVVAKPTIHPIPTTAGANLPLPENVA